MEYFVPVSKNEDIYIDISPCNRFSVSQNFCSSLKYLSSMNTLEMPKVVDIVVEIQIIQTIALTQKQLLEFPIIAHVCNGCIVKSNRHQSVSSN